MFFARDMGVRDVIFECDSKNVSYAMNSFSEPPIAIGNIIEGTWQKLLDFRSVRVSHVRKKGNCPAHIVGANTTYLSTIYYIYWWLCNLDRENFKYFIFILAQYGRYIDGYVTWIEKILNILFLS